MDLTLTPDSFNRYLNQISQYPRLPKRELDELFESYNSTKNQMYIQKIILHNLKFVVYIAKRYINYNLPLIDLVQEGNIGLMKSVKNYDHKTSTSFLTYAVHYIKAEILEYITKTATLVRCVTTKDHRKIFFNRSKFNSYPRPLTDATVKIMAKEMNVTPKSIIEMEERLNSSYLDSDHEHDPDNDSYNEVLHLESNHESPLDNILSNEDNIKLEELLDVLPERWKDIIINRFLIDKPLTFEALAEIYGVSSQRIAQIQKKAINQMKEHYEQNMK